MKVVLLLCYANESPHPMIVDGGGLSNVLHSSLHWVETFLSLQELHK